MDRVCGARIHIDGVVQGVGFRPFVFGLASRLDLTGWVRNTSAGVDIEVDGTSENLQKFIQRLQDEAPPLARIDKIQVDRCQSNDFSAFRIIESEAIPGAFQPISPDVSICPDCLNELFDPGNRRFHYPFLNCTNCGPRFTIIQDIPYDRPNTTMRDFQMCPDCALEYKNPLDRRFHAQPIACPECGPHLWVETSSTFIHNKSGQIEPQLITNFTGSFTTDFMGNRDDEAILAVQRLLAEGKIVAIKGIGGFHLACDAANPEAVADLRFRKLRMDKPFALMMPDISEVETHCLLDENERALLESRERPIVILRRRPDSSIASAVAPGQDTLGVMLPYTPLHYLLFAPNMTGSKNNLRSSSVPHPPSALVMTSGNLSEEPIAIDNAEARLGLNSMADAFLMHDRPIQTHCDDSVVCVIHSLEGLEEASSSWRPAQHASSIYFLRRSRGYAPSPILVPWELPSLLATGAELKNTFCLTRDRYAFLSHHIGDLETYETLRSFEEGTVHFERLFRIRPQALAYDLHPDYLSTRYALERAEREGMPAFGVQHHHAHIAACMAEYGLSDDQPVIGVAFDGTGYGEDGQIWGGEFLLSRYSSYQRLAHLAYVPLPGGDASVRRPARTALAYLWKAGIEWDPEIPSVTSLCVEERAALRSQLENNLNTPLTSSMGRLFDAVASLVGVRHKVNYEAQAAIELESLVDREEKGFYPIGGLSSYHPVDATYQSCQEIDTAPLVHAILTDQFAGVPVSIIAARFHNSLSNMVLEVCCSTRTQTGINEVVLSGGVWQNITLLKKTIYKLRQEGFSVYIHHQVPTNDGGLALGQALIAAHRFVSRKE